MTLPLPLCFSCYVLLPLLEQSLAYGRPRNLRLYETCFTKKLRNFLVPGFCASYIKQDILEAQFFLICSTCVS